MTELKKDDLVVRDAYVPMGTKDDGVVLHGVYEVRDVDGSVLSVYGSEGRWGASNFRKLEVGDIVRALDDPYKNTGWDTEMEVLALSNSNFKPAPVSAKPLLGKLSRTTGAFAPSELAFVRPRTISEGENSVEPMSPRDVIWARNWVVSMEDHMSASDLFDHLVGSGFLSDTAIRQLSDAFEGSLDGDV